MLYSNLKRPCIVFLLLVWCTTAFAQQKNKTTISGYVKQSANGESIIGASVFLKENGVGVATNNYGFYSLSVTPGNYTVVFQYLGFKSVERKINVTTATTININLESDGKQIDEVVVSSAGIKKTLPAWKWVLISWR